MGLDLCVEIAAERMRAARLARFGGGDGFSSPQLTTPAAATLDDVVVRTSLPVPLQREDT